MIWNVPCGLHYQQADSTRQDGLHKNTKWGNIFRKNGVPSYWESFKNSEDHMVVWHHQHHLLFKDSRFDLKKVNWLHFFKSTKQSLSCLGTITGSSLSQSVCPVLFPCALLETRRPSVPSLSGLSYCWYSLPHSLAQEPTVWLSHLLLFYFVSLLIYILQLRLRLHAPFALGPFIWV